MEEDNNEQNFHEEVKSYYPKIRGTINNILCVIFSILIVLQGFIFLISLVKHKNTIYMFGNLPYIAKYGDDVYGFNKGDLIIAKDEEPWSNKVVYEYTNEQEIIILPGYGYNLAKNSNDKPADEILNKVIKRGGEFILFMKEPYMIVTVITILVVIYAIICKLRKNYDNINLDAKYKNARSIKDLVLIFFIINIYISLFLVGKLYDPFDYNDEKQSIIYQEDVILNNAIHH